MVLLSNSASLLVFALAASFQLGNAVPYPQQGINSIVPNQQESSDTTASTAQEGGSCDEQTDRTVCADGTSLLFCSESKWVTYSNCTLGTICQDGYCVYPNEGSSGQEDSTVSAEQQQVTAVTNDVAKSDGAQSPSSVVDQSDTAAVASSSPAADVSAASSAPAGQQEGGVSSDAAATSAAEAGGVATDEATSAAESSGAAADESSSSDDSSSSDGGSSSGGSGSSYGITCDKFDKAVSDASKAIGQNYPTPSSAQCNAFIKGMETSGAISSATEAAMFLANILWESDGLRAKQEYDCVDNPNWCAQNYKTPEDAPGKTYWGRGYIQLTWEYNYKAASEGMYNDNRLVEDPGVVATNEDIAWGVSFWYWKKNVHTDSKVQAGQFGASINDINGALECKGSAQDKAKKRYAMYKAILPIFAPGKSPIESGCYN
ncbi:hypothetical protein IW140_003822 [Coemansia sp. RSA 1813]|nr:hypothetical protein EV178_004537 [Coemansia sp. RSA 1646]KAJ1769738.1 hypothetical protein LPJ74_003763 [Coemansia sp. RSA 1843]KAJ2090091.1 hypothetical protein IW138_002901 [Coemansia sp. RSA 986]KAJ2214166.1 hypothetical protein EV179_003186 [Coemansia sp. RSA 487]KAJ2568504.1 hypothetical protein IW140_003822 [Coemansia sp. RSA 1813]